MSTGKSQEQSIKDKLKAKRDETGVPFDILQKKFFIDCFLKLLSESQYSDNFVWKGGFVLSAITGIKKRTTVDLDTLITGMAVNSSTLSKVIQEIISNKDENGPVFKLLDIEEIQEEKAYQGLRVRIMGQLGQMKDNFHLDVVTGETLEQRAIKWDYQPLIGDRKIPIYIYRPEQILSEKLQTILERGIANTRMKDFYDVYIIPATTTLDIDDLSVDFITVMHERGTEELWKMRKSVLDLIAADQKMHGEWINYSKKNKFAEYLSFEQVLIAVNILFEKIKM
ncbi:nucleotidyl transferase AbiEii/AbiGii toxin family protein [Companilactobacillus huachuanensis]|uniref:Nucleotidyl transferase AbiEii/AbiGii toxin family protein n=1 Tax=Companilactobacillus huachuanensis TaxID=2559914 RepID=A0ABW1RJJ5_9LACO|nr:nucleotidyl transferase AbiEii/AbiGii toxin family protein [Companilactobacillus huachuanensis]